MKLVYFDWNIFTQLKNPEKEIFVGINKVIRKIKNTHSYPYSSAHLEDLKKGYKDLEPNLTYTNRDLNTLSNVCNDIFWWYDFRCNSLLSRKGNPANEFEPYKETEKSIVESINFDEIFSDTDELDLTKLSSDELSKIDLKALGLTGQETINMKELFANTMKIALNQTMPNPVTNIPDNSPLKKPLANMFQLTDESYSLNDMMQGMAKFVDDNKVDPKSYKELRTGFKDALKIPVDISNWKDNTWDRLDVLCMENMKKSFTDLILNSLKDQKLEPNLVNLFTTAYSFLDLFNFNPEKLSKKNTTANMYNDSMHALMAAHCDIFVSEDSVTRIKAKVLFDKFELKTDILTAEEFLKKYTAA